MAGAPTIQADEAAGEARRRKRRRRRVVIGIVAAAVVVAFFIVALRYYVSWLWFGEVGLRGVFWTRVSIGLVAGSAFAAVFFILFYGNVAVAARLAPRYRPVEGVDIVEFVRAKGVRGARRVGLVLGLAGAALAGWWGAAGWLLFARGAYGVEWGAADPVFGRDVGFYVFTLPAWEYAYSFLITVLVVALVTAFVAHWVVGGFMPRPLTAEEAAAESEPRAPTPVLIRIDMNRLLHARITGAAVAHLSALLAGIFLVGAPGYVLSAWHLLTSANGAVFGAGYTDVHLRLPLLRVMTVLVVLLAAALVFNAVRRRSRWWPALAVGVWLAASIVLLNGVPALWQALFVNPDQLGKETPYIERNIAATRASYALDAIAVTPDSLQGELTAGKLDDNAVTVRNIRLWDPEVLLRSYGQLQELRPYYKFTTVSVDRYAVNGAYTQTMLAPRELNLDGLPPNAQTWVNRHIAYTHGFGVTLSAVNQLASGGSPDFLVKDMPVKSAAASLGVRQPRIYYGLAGSSYVLVGTTSPEFDYPGAKGDVYTTYEGRGGVPVGSWLNRLALAARFGDYRFITTSTITPGSRVILYNDIRERVNAAAPFLRLDAEPYMVIAGGRLFWIVDAYTTTTRVPYSEPHGIRVDRENHFNYLRNSVKVVVDAYHGDMDFYVFDEQDPLLRAHRRIFPSLFRPASAMPAALREHVRYPQDLLRAQARLFATYHVTDPSVLYDKGNQWEVPVNVAISGAEPQSAFYMIMRLPGATREELALILPFAPNNRPNMIAWLAARSDAPNYGEAVSFEFPSSSNVFGPVQVEAVINQDPVISAQRTLWNQQGSSVIFGNLLTVPIAGSLLYVQPLYLQSSTTKLPQFQRVVVFYRAPSPSAAPASGQQQNVVMAATLGDALAEIFGRAPAGVDGGSAGAGGAGGGGGAAPPPGTAVSPAAARLIARANQQYEAAQEALEKGDLAAFARIIDELGETLADLRALQ